MGFAGTFSKFIARSSVSITSVMILLLALPSPALSDAPPLNAAAVHDRIVQLGAGHRVNIEERTGVVVTGRIAAIGAQSFTMRLSGDPSPLLLKYEDVADFPRGGPHGRTVFLFSAIGATAAFTIWALVHFHNEQKQVSTLPPLPSVP